MIPQIDLTRQHEALKVELAAAAARVLASCRFILGPEVAALESELASDSARPRPRCRAHRSAGRCSRRHSATRS